MGRNSSNYDIMSSEEFKHSSDEELASLLREINEKKKQLSRSRALKEISPHKESVDQGHLDNSLEKINTILLERKLNPVKEFSDDDINSRINFITKRLKYLDTNGGSESTIAKYKEKLYKNQKDLNLRQALGGGSDNSEQQVVDEEIKKIKKDEKVDEEKEEEIDLEKDVDKAQKEAAEAETKAAQDELKNSHEFPTPTPTGDSPIVAGSSSDFQKASQDAQQKKIEEAQELEDEKAEINQSVDEAVAALQEQRDAKIERVKSGPSGLVALFTSMPFFILVTLFDSLVSAIPGVGDIGMGIALAIFWFIPCMLLFDIFLYIKILFFLLIDVILGAVLGSVVGIAIPIIGDMLIDAVPEVIASMSGHAPHQAILKTHMDKIPVLIRRIKDQYQIKIDQVKAEGKDRWNFALKHIRGHFSGVASEGKKVVFILLVVLITYVTQVLGWFSISGGQLWYTFVFVLALLVLKTMGIIGMKEFNGLVAFLGFNIAFKYILRADGWIAPYVGSSNSIVVIILFIVFSLLLIYKIARPEDMSTQRMVGIFLFILLLLTIPFLTTYVGSDRFNSQIQKNSLERNAEYENLNVMERLTKWYGDMQAKGSGEYIPVAEQERVHEFIGVTIESVEPTREQFVAGYPVQFNIYYSTGSKETKYVRTACDTLGISGTIIPQEQIPATNLYTPPVKCTFEALPKGSHMIKVHSYYDESSQIEIPLLFMSDQKYQEIIENKGDPSSFGGGVSKPITSSGPIDFGVSNANGGLFKLPLVLNPEDLNKFPHLINLRLDNPVGDARTQGKLISIKRVLFDMPEGLQLGACNFQGSREQTILSPTQTDDGRWKLDITEQFNTVTADLESTTPVEFETISCNMYISEEYIDSYIPIGTDYSISTVYYTVDYTYKLEVQQAITII